ncbi:MAG TPA: NADH-quinone oxidoreductase subunit H, partial [Dehalococcoidia bacterium]|nr:NADH-quinone oxidoreductase subunit H [Dehalococcoidia bacterium]
KFGFFYQAEYLAGFAIAAIVVSLYLGGWTAWGLEKWVPSWLIFFAKLYGFFFLYIWFRGTLPRLRIDQLMTFAWKFLLPLALVNIMVAGGEVLLWREAELSRNVALPAFAVVNFAFAAVALVGWARALGHTRKDRSGGRAVLTQEVGAIYYEGAANP